MAYTSNIRYIYNTQKLVLRHIIKIYMHALSFPLVEFAHIACAYVCFVVVSAPIVFCNKIFILKLYTIYSHKWWICPITWHVLLQ